MKRKESYFPEPPDNVPDNFTKPSSAYLIRTIGVLLSLFGFLLVYLLLIAGSLYLGYLLITNPPTLPKGKGALLVIVAYVGGLLAVLMLILFLIKGLFKTQSTDFSAYHELQRKHQPELFKFIDQVCEATSAPRPSKVFLSSDVNAAVIYNTSLINLVIPPRKHLLIGAGLVNAVNMREFQAVLAHEFGHFSQKTLALGSYVYVANRIMGDIIYGRDKLDDALNAWSQIDVRISFPAWGLKGVIWCLRGILGGIFKGINLLNMSLSRQMEFNADHVAVSVSGSDAIVHTLCKIEFADQCFAVTAHDLSTAADHDIYTKDMYFHQNAAAEHIRKIEKKPKLGIPPEPPATVFDPEENSNIPAMWRSHPPNHEREANAKEIYIHATPDDRSPWDLFQASELLRKELTLKFYRLTLEKKINQSNLSEPLAVQEFIANERNEMNFDPKYHGLFDSRSIILDEIPPLEESDALSEQTTTQLLQYFNDYPSHKLERFMKDHHERKAISQIAIGIKSGELSLKETHLEFQGKLYTEKELKKLGKQIQAELIQDEETFKDWDRQMYVNHVLAAMRLGNGLDFDLKQRYHFTMQVTKWVDRLAEMFATLQVQLERASGGQMEESDFQFLQSQLRSGTDLLIDCKNATKKLECPVMSNVPPGTLLFDLIKSDLASMPKFRGERITGEEIGQLFQCYHATLKRLQRIYFKSVGNILAAQEQIAADFQRL